MKKGVSPGNADNKEVRNGINFFLDPFNIDFVNHVHSPFGGCLLVERLRVIGWRKLKPAEKWYVDGNSDCGKSLSIDWDTDDELEIESMPFSSGVGPATAGQEAFAECGEASSSNGSQTSRTIHHFVGMGFPKYMVVRAMKENGEKDIEAILEALLTYSAIEDLPLEEEHVSDDSCSSKCASNHPDLLSDQNNFPIDEENTHYSIDKDGTISVLVEMGYQAEEASIAIDRCGLYLVLQRCAIA
ncbi:hypothetical protein RHMOL_Rhmol12G0135800 [Rhododendron molle]|uniref:Uncharacterized protein n=1 Tax=Rhododendron molle TaxID=49168 RepID=A0ACC0LI36_RHOML|nr:hypothetical protein RHMOL_Rhmol12G0135800 [Rhododendron molle]